MYIQGQFEVHIKTISKKEEKLVGRGRGERKEVGRRGEGMGEGQEVT